MLTKVDYTDNYATQATPSSGGWSTRFDGGSIYNFRLDMPCDYVAMYVEGLIHLSGDEGTYHSKTEIHPSCFAVVVFRWVRRSIKGVGKDTINRYIYLQSRFGFTDRVRHDGLYDLKNAFEIARMSGGRNLEQLDEDPFHRGRRQWHIVPKTRVPGRIRQVLHKSLRHVDVVVTRGFGQGKDFFRIPSRSR